MGDREEWRQRWRKNERTQEEEGRRAMGKESWVGERQTGEQRRTVIFEQGRRKVGKLGEKTKEEKSQGKVEKGQKKEGWNTHKDERRWISMKELLVIWTLENRFAQRGIDIGRDNDRNIQADWQMERQADR